MDSPWTHRWIMNGRWTEGLVDRQSDSSGSAFIA